MKNHFLKTGFGFLFLMMISCGSETFTSADEMSLNDKAPFTLYPSPDRAGPTPSVIFEELMELVATIEKMSESELDSLEEASIIELSTPLSNLRYQTVQFPDEALAKLNEPLEQIGVRIGGGSYEDDEHHGLSSEIRRLSEDYFPKAEIRDELTTVQIRELFSEWNSQNSFIKTCEMFFNVTGSGVFLVPGDNFAAAHTFCSESRLFYVSDGTYYRQAIKNMRQNVRWIGSGMAKMDGMQEVEAAFVNGLNSTHFGWFEISGYTHFGLMADRKSGTVGISVRHMVFRDIGGSVNGQKHGAVQFEWVKDVSIQNSTFENVTSSIRFLNSLGPLHVTGNEAVNTGRNFFQCDKCTGNGIRIERNSMEHIRQFGTDKLEDFISLFKSYGTPTDYIRIRGNRARTDGTGNGVSPTGSFIILGDHGGGYQIAEENIGVNPGNVGIGAAGGNNMHVIGNVMFSDPIKEISNVAFYSYLEPPDPENSCSNHLSVNNRAYWYCFSDVCGGKETAVLNKAYSPAFETLPQYCGLTNEDINVDASVFEDPSVTHEIWNNF